MTLERKWLLDQARREREAMGRSIQYTEPSFWEADSLLAGWRNRDLVAHLAANDVAAAAVVAGEPAIEVDVFRKSLERNPFTVDGFNAVAVGRRFDEPFRAVVTEWGGAADLLLSRCSELSADDWTGRRVPWMDEGELRIPYLVQSRITEWWLHGEDLRAAVELPPRREHPPIFCTNDLAIRMLPYALSLAGLSFPGRSVEVRLEGAGGGRWHYGLGPHETPGAGKRPGASIEATGYQFAMLAGRRVPAEVSLRDGAVLTGGDTGLAELVLRHLRVFAV